ncbi:MAG: hypothetical protein AMXMBFR13_44160, partial [Phycisphaerae bacterium]
MLRLLPFSSSSHAVDEGTQGRLRWFEMPVGRWVVFALAAGFVGFVVACWIHEVESERFQKTQRQLGVFSAALGGFVTAEGRFPGPNLQDAINAMGRHEATSGRMRSCPEIVAGRDAWGTELVYSVDPTGQKATITSPGPNRTYEGGQGDDLSYSV